MNRIDEIRERWANIPEMDCGTDCAGTSFEAHLYEKDSPHARIATMADLYDMARLNALATSKTDIDYLLSCTEGRGVEDDDSISRRAAVAAVCSRCARPERYRAAEPMEGSERLWHFQGVDNWNAGQCDAAAIIRLPSRKVKE